MLCFPNDSWVGRTLNPKPKIFNPIDDGLSIADLQPRSIQLFFIICEKNASTGECATQSLNFLLVYIYFTL